MKTTDAVRVRATSLSSLSRGLTWLTAVAFGLLGLVLFFAPAWSAPRFAWNVSAFVTMTIGGWCLGTAWVAGVAGTTWRWAANQTALAFLWAFAILESLVLVWFRDKVVFEPLTWPYLIALGIGGVAAVVGVIDVIRLRPSAEDPGGTPMPRWLRTFVVLFILLVGGLSAVALLRPAQGANLRVFPEALSPFTVRAFGAFYLSLMIGAVPILASKTITSTILFDRAGLGLIVPITAAAFVYLDVFDLGAHPLQSAYIAAYLLVLLLSIPTLAWARRQARPPES